MDECRHLFVDQTGFCEWKSTVHNCMVRQEIFECRKCPEILETKPVTVG